MFRIDFIAVSRYERWISALWSPNHARLAYESVSAGDSRSTFYTRSFFSTVFRMTRWFCCVPDCNAASEKQSKLAKYPWMEGVTFHPLPKSNCKKSLPIRRRWIRLIRREVSWVPTKYTRICSRHFEGGEGPTPMHPDPTLFPYNNWSECFVEIH